MRQSWARRASEIEESEKQKEIVTEICKEVADRDMPTEEYVLIHPRAKLSRAEVQSISNWAHSVSQFGSEQAEKD